MSLQPSAKAPEIESFLEKIMGRSSAIRGGRCTSCGYATGSFRNALSAHEYTISGLCQNCQDEIFGED